MVLERKGEITRFQILVETAASQPQIKQSEIAASLGITPQAVSEYIKNLIEDGLITSSGRGQYKVTPLGVENIINGARELQEYSKYVLSNVVGQVSVWPAIAAGEIKKGSPVRVAMRDGVLYAATSGVGAEGTAACDASRGEDVGVLNLRGLIPLIKGRVKLIKVASIENGGSRAIDAKKLGAELGGLVGATGTEALAALHKAGASPDVSFG
ncbi:MAG TPA: winged helix-turn-helix transcriptional regulator, partial [Methanocella sp.]|nr:winged helix-turn-helix transcriptional regulator [Methanocella sp.]